MSGMKKWFAVSLVLLAFSSRAHAEIIVFTTSMSGPAEAPPNMSPGIGTATVTWDTVLHLMRVEANFSGLVAGTTASHIHAPTLLPGAGTAGVATQTPSFSGFPLGVTNGSMDTTFDMTLAASYNPAFIGVGTVPQAEAALLAALQDGKAYFNIHSQQFPGGEIRGFLAQQQPVIPEPSTVCLLGIGAVGLLGFAWRRKRQVK